MASVSHIKIKLNDYDFMTAIKKEHLTHDYLKKIPAEKLNAVIMKIDSHLNQVNNNDNLGKINAGFLATNEFVEFIQNVLLSIKTY